MMAATKAAAHVTLLTVAIVIVRALFFAALDVDGVVVGVTVAEPPLADGDGGAGDAVDDGVFDGVAGAV